MTWLAAAASASSSTRADQSQARPSLCSLRPPWLQSREMPELPVVPKASRTISENPTVPALGEGEHRVWGS